MQVDGETAASMEAFLAVLKDDKIVPVETIQREQEGTVATTGKPSAKGGRRKPHKGRHQGGSQAPAPSPLTPARGTVVPSSAVLLTCGGCSNAYPKTHFLISQRMVKDDSKRFCRACRGKPVEISADLSAITPPEDREKEAEHKGDESSEVLARPEGNGGSTVTAGHSKAQSEGAGVALTTLPATKKEKKKEMVASKAVAAVPTTPAPPSSAVVSVSAKALAPKTEERSDVHKASEKKAQPQKQGGKIKAEKPSVPFGAEAVAKPTASSTTGNQRGSGPSNGPSVGPAKTPPISYAKIAQSAKVETSGARAEQDSTGAQMDVRAARKPSGASPKATIASKQQPGGMQVQGIAVGRKVDHASSTAAGLTGKTGTSGGASARREGAAHGAGVLSAGGDHRAALKPKASISSSTLGAWSTLGQSKTPAPSATVSWSKKVASQAPLQGASAPPLTPQATGRGGQGVKAGGPGLGGANFPPLSGARKSKEEGGEGKGCQLPGARGGAAEEKESESDAWHVPKPRHLERLFEWLRRGKIGAWG